MSCVVSHDLTSGSNFEPCDLEPTTWPRWPVITLSGRSLELLPVGTDVGIQVRSSLLSGLVKASTSAVPAHPLVNAVMVSESERFMSCCMHTQQSAAFKRRNKGRPKTNRDTGRRHSRER